MVQNHTYWDASCTVGLPNQSNSYQSTLTCLYSGSLTIQLASQHVWFCTTWPDRAKGLFGSEYKTRRFQKTKANGTSRFFPYSATPTSSFSAEKNPATSSLTYWRMDNTGFSFYDWYEDYAARKRMHSQKSLSLFQSKVSEIIENTSAGGCTK